MEEISAAPANPPANHAAIYVLDNAGTTEIRGRGPGGVDALIVS